MHLTIEILIDPQLMRVVRKIGLMAALEAGFGAAQSSEVEVALSEALSDAFFHAHESSPGPVHVEIIVEGGELTLLVRDESPALAAPPAVPTTLQEADGRGLYLMVHLMDRMDLVRPAQAGQGTLVRLVKRLESPPPGPTGDSHRLVLSI